MPLILAAGLAMVVCAGVGPAAGQGARQPGDLAGTWMMLASKRDGACRLTLAAQRTEKGDYVLGMPAACRHSMPELAQATHWTMPDAAHLSLTDSSGNPVLDLAAAGGAFTAAVDGDTFTMKQIAAGAPAGGFAAVEPAPGAGFAAVAPSPIPVASKTAAKSAAAKPVAPAATTRMTAVAVPLKPADLAGRYAVMREKRDTGCMVTLDQSRTKLGDRAQLAPGCRDQGIVIFDPSAWQIVRGQLVLTARAGHKTRLELHDDGSWQKDPKEGGKPLGLKKL